MLYKKIDRDSLETLPPGLSGLFGMPLTNAAIEKAYERKFMPSNPINMAPYHIKVFTGTSYMDPRSIRLVTRFRLMKIATAGAKEVVVDEADDINVLNGLGANYIKNLRVMMGGQIIFDANNLYSHKVELDNLLNFSEDAKRSSMNVFGWYNDTKGKSKQYAKDKQEESWKQRKALFYDGNEVEFSAPLYADFFQQPLFVPSGVELDIEIYPQDTKFMVLAPLTMTTLAPKHHDIVLTITNVELYATFYDLHPGVALEIEKKLAAEPFKYAMRRTELIPKFIDHQKVISNIQVFNNIIPRNMFVVFSKKAAFHGEFKSDPMNFEHFNLRSIEIHAGNLRVPFVPFDFDWKKHRFIRGFEHLHRTLGLTGNNLDCGINRDMFEDGYTIWAFNLTSSLQDDETFDFVREGPTQMHLIFNEEVPDGGINAVCMAQWDSIMYIDQTRTVRTDLTA